MTAGHPVYLDKWRYYIAAEPISIDTNVWIGVAATILSGVNIGADAVVAAGAVVTHDVLARRRAERNRADWESGRIVGLLRERSLLRRSKRNFADHRTVR